MSQAEVSRLVSKLRYNLKDRRRLSTPKGPQGRHDKIRKTVTALLKYERIELNYNKADESRGYAEMLISDAIKYGDCHKKTMEMASYWLTEKPIVHKLFKVLAPRYKDFPLSYTKLWRAPFKPNDKYPKCVLELRNNIFPSLAPDKTNHKYLLHNILLSEAKKAYDKENALKTLQNMNNNNLGTSETEVTAESVSTAEKTDETSESVDNINFRNLKINDVEDGKLDLCSGENQEVTKQTETKTDQEPTVEFDKK